METPSPGLTYNLRIGTTPGGSEMLSPMAANNGYRKLVQLGNVNHNLSWEIRDLQPNTTYYWSVQALDNSFAGGPWAEEEVFFTGTPINEPPFWGTIFIDPDIIVPSDPTTFQNVVYTGQNLRTMYDRRAADWITVNAYLFNTSYDGEMNVEIQVNPEFGSPDSALIEAQRYAPVVGQMPVALRADLQTVWIHKGIEPFGGGNNNLLIHTGQAKLYIEDNILEETIVHELAHTSLDAYHSSAEDWIMAQTADSNYISIYASDNPETEDIVSFLPWLAVQYKSDRITPGLQDSIEQAISNRMIYFENQLFNMYPVDQSLIISENNSVQKPNNFILHQNYPNPFNPKTIISYELPSSNDVQLNIYNLVGQKIATLVSEKQEPGKYQVEWNAIGLSSGIYYYYLKSGEYQEVKKMILVK